MGLIAEVQMAELSRETCQDSAIAVQTKDLRQRQELQTKKKNSPLVARSARLKPHNVRFRFATPLCGYKTAPAANSTSPNGPIKIKSQCTPEKEGITCQRQLTGKDDARLRENSTDFLRRLMRCLVDTNAATIALTLA